MMMMMMKKKEKKKKGKMDMLSVERMYKDIYRIVPFE